LVEQLPGTAIVSLDSYYGGMEAITLQERELRISIRWIGSCSTSTCRAMAAGREFEEPIYSFED
jgi:hypothetical protein